MRTIKFRAWDKVNNQMIPDMENWIDFGGIYWTTPDKTFDSPNQEIYTPVVQPILMQFTGLLDKNGKEIYEGDIVKYTLPAIDELHEDTEYIEPVEYIGSGFCLDGYVPVDAFVKAIEVIGNIYENPEL